MAHQTQIARKSFATVENLKFPVHLAAAVLVLQLKIVNWRIIFPAYIAYFIREVIDGGHVLIV